MQSAKDDAQIGALGGQEKEMVGACNRTQTAWTLMGAVRRGWSATLATPQAGRAVGKAEISSGAPGLQQTSRLSRSPAPHAAARYASKPTRFRLEFTLVVNQSLETWIITDKGKFRINARPTAL